MVGRLDAFHPGHANIEQHDVRLRARRDLECFVPVPGLADNLVIGLIVENLPQALACGLLVVDDEDFHGAPSSTGKRNATVYAASLSSTVTEARLP